MDEQVAPPIADPQPPATDALFADAHCTVTVRLFKTKRRTYQISRIEKTEVRRPLLVPLTLIGLALIVFAFQLKPYLFDSEFYAAACTGGLLAGLAARFGILVVQSKALTEPALFGSVGRLAKVRDAIDQAIEANEATGGFYATHGLRGDRP